VLVDDDSDDWGHLASHGRHGVGSCKGLSGS
jgi:hypothetical protein